MRATRPVRRTTLALGMSLLAAAGLTPLLTAAGAQPQSSAQSVSGNAERGKTLFADTYRCYACHGSTGETGLPRLVPMARSQDGFIAYLRKPATPLMPSFAHVPEPDLADVYAYLRAVRADASPIDSIPLLKDLLQRISKKE